MLPKLPYRLNARIAHFSGISAVTKSIWQTVDQQVQMEYVLCNLFKCPFQLYLQELHWTSLPSSACLPLRHIQVVSAAIY